MPSGCRCAPSSVSRIGGIVLIGLVLLAGLAGPVLGQQTTTPPETDNTITRIQLQADGDAVWVVQIRTRLTTDGDVRDYEAFQEVVRANRSVLLDPFQTRMTGVASQAGNVTGRSMGASNFSVETSIQEVPRRWGVVTYRFRWTAFAQVEDDRVVVGDVFDAGFFLSEDDVLEVVAPPGYTVDIVAPTPDTADEGTVSWVGREDFADGRPSVAVRPRGQATTDSPSGATASRQGPAAEGPSSPGPVVWVGAALVLLVALVTGWWLVRRRRPRTPTGGSVPTTDQSSSPPPEEPAPADPGEIMTDEERVEETLRSHGGRMRQAEIAEALEWSTSKTSRVLSGMAEAGRVDKLQLGRENVIDLPDTDQPE